MDARAAGRRCSSRCRPPLALLFSMAEGTVKKLEAPAQPRAGSWSSSTTIAARPRSRRTIRCSPRPGSELGQTGRRANTPSSSSSAIRDEVGRRAQRRRRSRRWRASSPAAAEAGAGRAAARERWRDARAALAAGRPALVWRRLVADTETPVGAALKLIEPGRGDFLLESVEGGEVRGRYSLLGLDPDLVFRATGARLRDQPRLAARPRRVRAAARRQPGRTARAGRRLPHRRARRACRRRSPAWSAISATRPSAWSKTLPRAPQSAARAARHAVRAPDADPGVRPAERRAVLRRPAVGRRRRSRARARAARRADRRGAAPACRSPRRAGRASAELARPGARRR